MIKEINNPTKYRYAVDYFGYRYFFLNREDAYKLDRHREKELIRRQNLCIESLPIIYKKATKVNLDSEQKQAFNYLHNLINQIIMREVTKDRERVINAGYYAVLHLDRTLNVGLTLPAELSELKYKSKWTCVQL